MIGDINNFVSISLVETKNGGYFSGSSAHSSKWDQNYFSLS
jgi:hypothetical protein